MKTENLILPRRQTNWDWRAAGNFIGGGSGTGLLVFSAIVAGPNLSYLPLAGAGLVLIALGLLCVWMEIGRPLRAINVFLHAQTSWMTREALVAPPLFLCGALAAWTGSGLLITLTALLALLFLYCQARIVNAAKGIPAWRAPRIVPLFITTGLTEGAGLLALALVLSGAMPQAKWIAATLVPLLIVRALLWRAYRKELGECGAPRQTLKVLDAIELPLIKLGHWAVLALLLLALAVGGTWLIGVAGLLAAAGGWLLKYTLIVRASFNQGYALPRLPVRGAGAPASELGAKS
jgi:phenylacetyl-CoA:acceptor oxidoreductase 26-kDa subunit